MAITAQSHRAAPQRSFRVHVYAGTDPVTGKPRRLKQTCPDEASAAAALGKLLAQADGDRFPNREATLGQALAKYLEVADLEVSTREVHEGAIRRTIGPVLMAVRAESAGGEAAIRPGEDGRASHVANPAAGRVACRPGCLLSDSPERPCR